MIIIHNIRCDKAIDDCCFSVCFFFEDFANEPKTEATEPIWLPSDPKEAIDDIITDDKFVPTSNSGESSSHVQVK